MLEPSLRLHKHPSDQKTNTMDLFGFVQHDDDLSVIKLNKPVRNALMLGLKVKLIRARHVD